MSNAAARRQPYPPFLDKRALLNRQGGRCALCHMMMADGEELTVDHIVPVAAGGKSNIANLQIAHVECNALKGSMPDVPRRRAVCRDCGRCFERINDGFNPTLCDLCSGLDTGMKFVTLPPPGGGELVATTSGGADPPDKEKHA